MYSVPRFKWKYQSVDTILDNVLVPLPVPDDSHYLTVLRYIETNPIRAGLVKDAAERLKLLLNTEAERKTQKIYPLWGRRTTLILPIHFIKPQTN